MGAGAGGLGERGWPGRGAGPAGDHGRLVPESGTSGLQGWCG